MSKFYRVRVIVDTEYDVKACSEEEAIIKHIIIGYAYSLSFDIEEIDEEEYEGA